MLETIFSLKGKRKSVEVPGTCKQKKRNMLREEITSGSAVSLQLLDFSPDFLQHMAVQLQGKFAKRAVQNGSFHQLSDRIFGLVRAYRTRKR